MAVEAGVFASTRFLAGGRHGDRSFCRNIRRDRGRRRGFVQGVILRFRRTGRSEGHWLRGERGGEVFDVGLTEHERDRLGRGRRRRARGMGTRSIFAPANIPMANTSTPSPSLASSRPASGRRQDQERDLDPRLHSNVRLLGVTTAPVRHALAGGATLLPRRDGCDGAPLVVSVPRRRRFGASCEAAMFHASPRNTASKSCPP